jgi:replicative DNA helicase
VPNPLNNANPEIPEIPEEPLASIEAEQAVLGALLVNNDTMLHVGQLRAGHFYEPLHTSLFCVMLREWNAGRVFTPITIKGEFGLKLLSNMAANASIVKNVSLYADTVIDLALRRQLRSLFSAATQELHILKEKQPIVMMVNDWMEKIICDSDTQMFSDDFEVTESIIAGMKSDVLPFTTGYSKLDDAMGGGLYPGKSYGFAARKKLGKTILAGSIAQNLNDNGVRHLFICGEMSPAEVHKRTLGRLLRVKPEAFHGGEAKNTQFMQRIAETAVASKKNIIYKNAPGLTFDDLKRYVLLARMQKKITGFILDYWQLVGGKRKGQSTAEHLDEVAQWIADTCRKYDLWSIVMAQINQEGNTRGGEGIRLAFDQVYVLRAPREDAGRSERWLEMSDTRYTQWRSVGSEKNPGFYMNEFGPHFSKTAEDTYLLGDDL